MHDVNDLNAFNADFNGYRLSDRKQGTGPGKTSIVYYGYINQYGDYYIMANNTTDGTYRFFKGSGSYTTAFVS